MTRQAHTDTVAKQGIEQKLIQMGAEQTEMLLASQNHRNASRQPATPLPTAQPRPPTAAQVADTAAQWGRYVENIQQHDEKLRLEHQASLDTAGSRTSQTVIRDVYRPTSIVNGQRAGGGGKVVLTYSQAAAASTNEQPALTSNGSSHTFSVQQPVQETPVQQPLSHFGDDVYDLLSDISLIDSTHADTNGSIGLLAGHAPELPTPSTTPSTQSAVPTVKSDDEWLIEF